MVGAHVGFVRSFEHGDAATDETVVDRDTQERAATRERFVSVPFVRQKLGTWISTEREEDLETLRERLEAGKVRPLVDRTFPVPRRPSASSVSQAPASAGMAALASSAASTKLPANGSICSSRTSMTDRRLKRLKLEQPARPRLAEFVLGALEGSTRIPAGATTRMPPGAEAAAPVRARVLEGGRRAGSISTPLPQLTLASLSDRRRRGPCGLAAQERRAGTLALAGGEGPRRPCPGRKRAGAPL
jgi:hypothetical protein